jgi:predicted  nucleic acid-binding Zn-ribbon protein
MDELSSLEKQIYLFIQKYQEQFDSNKRLEKTVKNLQKETEVYKLKIEELESKLNKAVFDVDELFNNDSLKLEDKEALRNKVNELITIIDYHLRS